MVVDDAGAATDPNILVDDGTLDHGARPDAHSGQALGGVGGDVFSGLEKVVPQDHRVADHHVTADPAPQANHAVFDHGPFFDETAVGQQAVPHGSAVDP